MNLNSITQNPNVSLCIYIKQYSKLPSVATGKTAHENTDPTRLYHFVASINNTTIADKIAKQVQDVPQTLQDVFEKALTLGAGSQLVDGVHLRRFSQVMQVSIDEPNQCGSDNLDRFVHQVQVRGNWVESNGYWMCGDIYFHKDCTTTLPTQDGNRKDKYTSYTNPTIGNMTRSLTASTI